MKSPQRLLQLLRISEVDLKSSGWNCDFLCGKVLYSMKARSVFITAVNNSTVPNPTLSTLNNYITVTCPSCPNTRLSKFNLASS